jgi:Transposase IS4
MNLQDTPAKGSSQILNMPCDYDNNSRCPETLFSLFFTASVLNRIVRCTNLNAEKARDDPTASRPKNCRFHNSSNRLAWKPVTSNEILAYIISEFLFTWEFILSLTSMITGTSTEMIIRLISLCVKQWVSRDRLESIDIFVFGILPQTALEDLAQEHDHTRKLVRLPGFSFLPFSVIGDLDQVLPSMSAFRDSRVGRMIL